MMGFMEATFKVGVERGRESLGFAFVCLLFVLCWEFNLGPVHAGKEFDH